MIANTSREKRRQLQWKIRQRKTARIRKLKRTNLRLRMDAASFMDRKKAWPLLKGEKNPSVDAILTATFLVNNTFVNMRTLDGKTIFKVSAGSLKNLKKSSSFANLRLGERTVELAKEHSIQRIKFEAYGFGQGRKTFFKGLNNKTLKILQITMNPLLAHNGCRPPKQRRL